MSNNIYLYPNPFADELISSEYVDQWSNQGYLFLDGVLPHELVTSASDELYQHYKSDQYAKEKKDFGGVEYPFKLGSAFNDITLHPTILSMVTSLLGTQDILLTQADAWVKFYTPSATSDLDNRDQRMHIDVWNHTLVVPNDWFSPASIAMILYLSDSDNTGGETAVVPREGSEDPAYNNVQGFLNTPGAGSFPWINDKEQAEKYFEQDYPEISEFRKALYKREKKVKFNTGSLLVYRHDLWHRGTPLTVDNSFRIVLNLSFRRADAPWFQHWCHGWARSMYSREQTMEKLIASMSMEQRSALGFPKPGDKYWTKATLAAVKLRYECFGFDASPYEALLT
jgi:hypothetical protein